MVKLIVCFAVFSSTLSFANELVPDFDSANKLSELWQSEQIYFVPQQKENVGSWQGMIYHYPSKKCYQSEPEKSGKIASKEVPCDSAFMKKATEPYISIVDFDLFRKKLLSCLETNDEQCLRGLISKTLQS